MLIRRERVSRTLVHKALIALGFLMLYWPAVTTNLFGDGLAGYEPSSPAPETSVRSWLDGDFQKAADKWWRERFGMRFFFVKLDNQLDYWLYDRTWEGTSSLIIGDGDWFYQRFDVDAYCMTQEPSDEQAVREGLAAVRAFQDAMDERGVPFVFLLTPGKAAVYPGPVPDSYCAPHDSPGHDYDVYRPLLDEYGLRYVDGLELIEAAKPDWPEITLFARGGAHWNELGALPAARAVLEAARPLSTKTIPPLRLLDVSIDHEPDRHDRDLVEFQNLLFPDTDFPVPHPRISMDRRPEGGLHVALVGQSFLEQLAALYARSGGFGRVDHYWYYETGVRDYLSDEWTPHTRETVDWEGGILAADVVVLDLQMIAFASTHVRRFAEDGVAHLATHPRPTTAR